MLHQHVQGIGHIAIQVSDLQEGLNFFRDVLGFKVKFETRFEGFHIVMLKAGKLEIEMWQAKSDQTALPTAESNDAPGVHHLAVNVDNLDLALEDIRALHIPVLQDVYVPTRGLREAIIEGPDCLRIQLVEENVPVLIWRALTGDFRKEVA